MNVQNLPIDSIIPYARNPRKNQSAVASVKASLKEYGFKQSIVVDKEKVIIVGHTRYLAALDWNTLREYLTARLLPGPWETIHCSSRETAERIADWLNGQAKNPANRAEVI